MKNALTFLLFVLIFSNSVNSQSWQKISPYPTAEQLECVYFYDSNLGFANGSNGIVLRTTDSGNTWSEIFMGNYDVIHGIYFTDANTGYACGYQKWILKTTDAGLTWITLTRTAGSNVGYQSIVFTDANTGYVVGENGIIVKSTDAGSTWNPQTSGVTYTIQKILALSSTTLVAVGYGGANRYCVLKTTNGGTNWVEKNSASPAILLGACTPDNVNIFASNASGGMYKSTDAGETWSGGTTGTTNQVYGIWFNSTSVGYIADFAGHIYKTTNGGTNWSELTNGVPSSISLLGVFFKDSNNGFSCGSSGVLLKTTDAGSSWTSLNSGINAVVYSWGAWFTDINTGYIGDGYSSNIYKTTNGGNSWTNLNVGSVGCTYDIFFIDSNDGYAVTDGPNFLKTTNSGSNWSTVSLTSSLGTTPTSVQFLSSSVGYIVGGSKIIKTTDGGSNWTPKKSDFPQSLNSCFFLDANNGFVAGAAGYIAKTTDGGTSWNDLTTGITDLLWSVFFYNSNYGVACGDAGKIIKTTDGGTDWSDVSISTPYTFYKTKMYSQSRVLTVGSAGMVFFTSDGGQNWNDQSIGTFNSFYTICTVGADAFIIGDAGMIYKNVTPMPVELTSLRASLKKDHSVTLNWKTSTEVNNYGFNVERRVKSEEWKEVGFVKGNGNSNSLKEYSFKDDLTHALNLTHTLLYRLKQIDNDGSIKYSEVVEVAYNSQPATFELYQNYPNPFNPSTMISYQLAVNSNVSLKIYNSLGEEIETLVNGYQEAGFHSTLFTINSSLPSGIYLYKLESGSINLLKKMILLK